MDSDQPDHATIVSAAVTARDLVVILSDGRTVSVPLSLYPRLTSASPASLRNLRTSPFGVHWDELDEDVGLTGILSLQNANRLVA